MGTGDGHGFFLALVLNMPGRDRGTYSPPGAPVTTSARGRRLANPKALVGSLRLCRVPAFALNGTRAARRLGSHCPGDAALKSRGDAPA